jgi:lysozyme family protein
MSIETLLDTVIAREGGYVNDPRDAGGETIWGVTAETARANGYAGPMKAMTRDQAKQVYRSAFWVRPRFDRVAALSAAIAAEMFDTGVNMGPSRAATFLQMALNGLNNGGTLYPDIAEDGRIGPGTLTALQAYLRKRGQAGETVLLRALSCLRGARYIELARRRGGNEAFLYGWLANRVAT